MICAIVHYNVTHLKYLKRDIHEKTVSMVLRESYALNYRILCVYYFSVGCRKNCEIFFRYRRNFVLLLVASVFTKFTQNFTCFLEQWNIDQNYCFKIFFWAIFFSFSSFPLVIHLNCIIHFFLTFCLPFFIIFSSPPYQ